MKHEHKTLHKALHDSKRKAFFRALLLGIFCMAFLLMPGEKTQAASYKLNYTTVNLVVKKTRQLKVKVVETTTTASDATTQAPGAETIPVATKAAEDTTQAGTTTPADTMPKITWSSSNKKIAKVSSNGKITAVKAGNTTIKAKIGSKTLKCTVHVVSLNKSKVSLTVGSKKTIKVSNGKKTSWKTSNSKVATVKSGKITAKKSGTATITCTSRGQKMTCKVYVPKINKTKTTLDLITSAKSKVTLKISNAAEKATFSSSNSKVVKVGKTSGKCTALKVGKATISAKVSGLTYKCKITVVDTTPPVKDPEESTEQKPTEEPSVGDPIAPPGPDTSVPDKPDNAIVTPESLLPTSSTGLKLTQKVNTSDGKTLTYTVYRQSSDNGFKNNITLDVDGEQKTYNVKTYISNHGCAACAATVVLSGIAGLKEPPTYFVENIERKLLGFSKWNANYSKDPEKQMPITLYGIQKIYSKYHIKSTYVPSFNKADAIADIKGHLYKGKPVIATLGNGKKNLWSNSYHTVALIGMTDTDKVIVADSANRTDTDERKKTFGNQQRIKLVKLESLVDYILSCSKDGTNVYFGPTASSGGYLKVENYQTSTEDPMYEPPAVVPDQEPATPETKETK